MENRSYGPILIGLAYLGLVVFIIIFCADQSDGFDNYSKYWGLFGTLIGVATGAMPSFFFKSQADKASETAAQATETADKAARRAEIYAQRVNPADAERIRDEHSELF